MIVGARRRGQWTLFLLLFCLVRSHISRISLLESVDGYRRRDAILTLNVDMCMFLFTAASACPSYHRPTHPQKHPVQPRVLEPCFFFFLPHPVPPFCCIFACRRLARVRSACCAFCVLGLAIRAGHPSPTNVSIRFVFVRHA